MNSTENTETTKRSRPSRWWLLLALPVVLGGGFYAARAYAFGGMGMGGGPDGHHAFMQRRLEKMLDKVDATSAQRASIKTIIERLHTEMAPIHKEHAQLRDGLKKALAAPTVDGVAVENLRIQAAASMDRGSRQVSKALVEAANVLTAEQRKLIIEHIGEQHGRMHRGF
jgi:Spy/CpxP family protein refolding chaperone